MIIYSVILFAVAALVLVMGLLIRRGRTDLIHDYHQTRVKDSDRAAYGRSFSVGMLVLALFMALSGGVALLGDTKPVVMISLAILFIGLAVSLALIVRVQKKYNGGMF
jgi:Na+-driven multidrug efflux pump